MRKVILFSIFIVIALSCKNDKKTTEFNKPLIAVSENEQIIKGNFIYYDDAGVFQTNTEIYGVVIDEMMLELNDKIEPFKEKKTDIIPVTVKVKKFKHENPTDVWENWVAIKEIIDIHDTEKEETNVIKTGS